jgi:hypothetical protein
MRPNVTQARWPVIDSVLAPLTDWWRHQATVRENLADLAGFRPEETARMAQDVGLAPTELQELACHGSDAAELLDRRLSALGLSKPELAVKAPAELRDMERLCTLCSSKGRCRRDLAADASDPAWRQYCPNEQTLAALAQEGIED